MSWKESKQRITIFLSSISPEICKHFFLCVKNNFFFSLSLARSHAGVESKRWKQTFHSQMIFPVAHELLGLTKESNVFIMCNFTKHAQYALQQRAIVVVTSEWGEKNLTTAGKLVETAVNVCRSQSYGNTEWNRWRMIEHSCVIIIRDTLRDKIIRARESVSVRTEEEIN
jgi:hypothetical protein